MWWYFGAFFGVSTLGYFLIRNGFLQRKLIYANTLKLPLFLFPLNYSKDKFHRNVKLSTPDKETLGAWVFYKDLEYEDTERFVLYLHGNAGTRGQARRYRLYDILSKIFNSQIFCFDYRGFGDSTGAPDEEGVLIDAITAWNYIIEEKNASHVVLWGHSLGTGIGCRLAELISQSDNVMPGDPLFPLVQLLAPNSKEKFKGLFLEAPFESIETAAQSHYFGAILWPLPQSVRKYILRNILCLGNILNSIERIEKIQVPIMIVHAKNDWIISIQQGINLACRMCESLCPPASHSDTVTITSGRTASNFPCRLAIFPDGGHNNVGTQPEFNEIISNFKQSIDGFND